MTHLIYDFPSIAKLARLTEGRNQSVEPAPVVPEPALDPYGMYAGWQEPSVFDSSYSPMVYDPMTDSMVWPI